MNIKDLLLPLGLALVSFWLVQYFFFDKKGATDNTIRAGQQFTAPQTAQAAKPLNTEVDFIDMKRPARVVRTELETDGAHYVFSTDAASLERLEFKRQAGREWITLGTVFPPNEYEREQRCFLVALDENTPYFYQLVDKKETDCDYVLTYRTDHGDCSIEKEFKVYKHTYQIDLKMKFVPKGARIFEPRLFFGSPQIPELKGDLVSGVMSNDRGSVDKKALRSLDPRIGWFSPQLFGSDDKYFINAMVNDSNSFINRAYYNVVDQDRLFSILEGGQYDKEVSWGLSFYFGPKELHAMTAVDSTLEQTLDYAGWLAPIAKFMLAFLMFIFSYVGNYGWAIIILTLLIRLILLPFTFKGEQNMKKQADFQKKLAYIKQKYQNDKQRLAQEQSELIRKHGMPGMASCLPMLLQLPIFYVLSRVLQSSIELYQAPFILWIRDLSAPDPYYVLPILVAVSMLLQPQPASSDIKTRLPMMGMALVFGAFSSTFSAGLTLYIFSSTILNVVQAWIQRRLKKA